MNRLGFKNTLIVVVIGLLIVALGITSYLSISKLEETAKSSLITSITHSSQYEAQSIHRYITQHAQPVTNLAALYKKIITNKVMKNILRLVVRWRILPS